MPRIKRVITKAEARGSFFIHRWTDGQMDRWTISVFFIAKMSTNPYLRLFRPLWLLGHPFRMFSRFTIH